MKSSDLRKELERTLLSRYNGAGVVVDETLEVLEILGQTAPYLSLPTGKVSFNLLKLIPETRLFLEVEKLVREVARSGEAARQDRIPYQGDGSRRRSESRSDSSGRHADACAPGSIRTRAGRIRHRAGPRLLIPGIVRSRS